jgi:hypothetical protein
MTHRFEPREREGVYLTARDLRVVEAVFAARYLTGRQIGRLLFGRANSSHCRSRLRVLFDLGYLRKRDVGQNDPDVYYLGLQGRRYLAEAGLCSRALADRVAGVSGEGAGTPGLMMAHDLALSELYVGARLEAEGYGWTLVWRNARMLELEGLGVQPDAWLQVHHGGRSQEAYLEVTAAMPTAVELAGKLEGYRAYWERSKRPCAVLWLASAQPHATSILEAVRSGAYGDCFLVGLIEEARGFLTRRMWRWGDAQHADGADMVQWLQPPTTVGGQKGE